MPGLSQQTKDRLAETRWTDDHINIGAFDQSAYAAGTDESAILEYKTPRPLYIKTDESLDAAIIAHESFTTDGAAGDVETFNIAGELIEAPPTAPNVVAYVDGNRVSPDSVTYGESGTSAVSLPDDGTTNAPVDIFYATGDQASIEVQKVAPNGSVKQPIVSQNSGVLNRRPQNEQPFFLTPETEADPVVPSDFTLRVTIQSSDVSVAWADSAATAAGADPINFVFSIPVQRGDSGVEGLGDEVRMDMALQ